jgi:hypothetical protein
MYWMADSWIFLEKMGKIFGIYLQFFLLFSISALISYPSVYGMSNDGVQEGSTWRFTFTLAGRYKSGNSVRFTFPEGFETLSARCDYLGVANNPPQAIILHNYRMVECRNIMMDLRGSQEVRIINMVNPKYSG